MLAVLQSFIFGIIEGITEWLPVSSTGHIILFNELWPLDVSESFYKFYEVVIQLGAIMAVVILFWKNIWPFGKKNNKAPLSSKGFGSVVKKDVFSLWFHIIVSCIPAVIVGVLFDDFVTEHFEKWYVVAIMLILVGVVFIIVETVHKKKGHKASVTSVSNITYKTALIIGLFQVVAAVLPGTSRSGATIIGALLIGVSRSVAAEYTFYLAIPVMFGASILRGAKALAGGMHFSNEEICILAVGIVVSFIVSLIVIKLLMGYIKKHDFRVFGWYRIVLGLAVIGFFLAKNYI